MRTNICCIALKRKRVLLSLLAILKDVIKFKCCEKQNRWLNDKAIIELGVSGEQINNLPLPLPKAEGNIDLLATDKSRYFAKTEFNNWLLFVVLNVALTIELYFGVESLLMYLSELA